MKNQNKIKSKASSINQIEGGKYHKIYRKRKLSFNWFQESYILIEKFESILVYSLVKFLKAEANSVKLLQ